MSCLYMNLFECICAHTRIHTQQKDQLSLQRLPGNGGRVRISADDGLSADGTTTDDGDDNDDGSDYSGSSTPSYVESLRGPEDSFIIWFLQLLTITEDRCLKSLEESLDLFWSGVEALIRAKV